MTRKNGTGPALVVLPVGMQEPEGLRELISEVHRATADLKTERREVERLLAEQAHGLIVEEVRLWFDRMAMQEVVTQFRENAQLRLDQFGHEASGLLRTTDRVMDARVAEMDELIASLRIIRARWEQSVSGAPYPTAVPPAFGIRRGNGAGR